MATRIVNSAGRLDRLPIGSFHWRLFALIGAGMFFDGLDSYIAAGVLGATTKSGYSDLAHNAHFVSATFIGMTIGAFVAGMMGDRLGRRTAYQVNLLIFGVASLAACPRLVMLRISAYGQTGPMRGKPGFARIAHGFSGLSYLAGEPGRPPGVPGSTSLADYMSGVWGCVGVMMALRQVAQTGQGQVVDIGLYESIFRMLDEIAPVYAAHGTVRERMGADVPAVVPHGHWCTADGRWIALACSSDKMFERLAKAVGKPELAGDGLYGTTARRVAARGPVNALVSAWVGSLDYAALMVECDNFGVPCGPINSIADIFEDHQFKARGNMLDVEDPRIGRVVLPAGVPTLSDTPPVLRHTGRALGVDTDAVLRSVLGLSADQIDALRASRAV